MPESLGVWDLRSRNQGSKSVNSQLSSPHGEEQIQRARQNLRRCLRRLNVLRESREFSAKATRVGIVIKNFLEHVTSTVQPGFLPY